MTRTVNHKQLIELGFSKSASKQIIKEGKLIAVKRFEEARNSSNNVVHLSKSPFDNRRLDLAPTSIVEELLGFQISL
ncbi:MULTISPECIES: DUF3173 family protein [Streptococcus]|jgi:hypothetical protein|uniref:DUF3173 domain-containing protein n=1 Tax=Streptococcus mitis TaxID=28037 RepID=A0A7X1URD8_STRMT|nr:MULTISPECIES: DUF3173 family protein [Streptococcus]MBS9406153.1 DUF3173 family protein [Streptococcus oralis]MQQ01445.1 DUF3173 domain-containing protein [Streptococcus mitis]OFL47810.1 hypothetical protein HMPREF2766_02770 [Streptococcus sp. HMSC076C08]SDP19804.1 protein of unknown function [Streptococcus sp. NLAE-zl-C503]